MAQITVNRRSKVYRILARGSVGLGRDFYFLTGNVISGAASSAPITFQATLVQSAQLNYAQQIQDQNAPVTDEELVLLSQYQWDRAPAWANFAAVNSDGTASWYAAEPVVDEARGRWTFKYGDNRSWPMYSTVRMFRPWRESLVERPVIQAPAPVDPSVPQPTVPPVPLSATVGIEVSNDAIAWLNLGTISLNEATPSDGFASPPAWAYIRANLTSVAGQDAFVMVNMGV